MELIFEVPIFFTILLIPIILLVDQLFFKTKLDKFIFILFIYLSPGHLFITYLLGSTYIYLKNIYALVLFVNLFFLMKDNKIGIRSFYKSIIYILFFTVVISTFIPFIIEFITSPNAKLFFSVLRRSLHPIVFLAIGYFTLKIGFNKIFFEKIVKLFVIIGLILVIDGFLGYILGFWKNFATYFIESRLQTFYGRTPDVTIRYLTLGIVSAYYLYFDKKKPIFLLYVLFSIPIYIYAVTRAGYILFGLALVLLILSNLTKIIPYIHIIIILIPLLLAAYSLAFRTFSDSRSDHPYNTATMENRFRRWDAIYKFIEEDPEILITGAGLDNWHYMMSHKYKKSSIGVMVYMHSMHNAFIEFMAENGILGIFWVTVYILTSFYLIITGFFKNKRIIYASVFSLIVIAMVMNISWEQTGIFIVALYLLFSARWFTRYDNKPIFDKCVNSGDVTPPCWGPPVLDCQNR